VAQVPGADLLELAAASCGLRVQTRQEIAKGGHEREYYRAAGKDPEGY